MPRDMVKQAAYIKQWRIDNAEKAKVMRKQQYINNREKAMEDTTQWGIDNPEKVKKNKLTSSWKSNGMIGDLSFIYDNYYLPATNCWVCNKIFKNTRDRCCDHDHSITDGDNWRQILCRKCNNNDSWKNHSEWV